MALTSMWIRYSWGKNDKKRDANLVIPDDIQVERDIKYVPNGDKWNLLDVNYRKDVEGLQPAIVSIHGGAYVYGSKEVYKHYCAYLASLGFTVINFNYHRAPEHKFPTQLTEINQVMEWIDREGQNYHIDKEKVFLVGDSAGAQMCSQYAAIFTNPEFEKLFPFNTPKAVKIRAIALNCGMYQFSLQAGGQGREKFTQTLYNLYIGTDDDRTIKMLDTLGHITADYPPTFVMTSYYDFLRVNAEPMHNFLKEKGIETEFKCYGTEDQKYMEHVCHVNMNLDEAKVINQDEAEFFKRYV
jgi:acetyl esterase/lipase